MLHKICNSRNDIDNSCTFATQKKFWEDLEEYLGGIVYSIQLREKDVAHFDYIILFGYLSNKLDSLKTGARKKFNMSLV